MPESTRGRILKAALLVVERALENLECRGEVDLAGARSTVARYLATELERSGVLALTRETAVALELIAADWRPVHGDLAEASIHGIHLAGIVLAGEEDHVADYLRVVEAQDRGRDPLPLDEYRPLARRIRRAWRETAPAPAPPGEPSGISGP